MHVVIFRVNPIEEACLVLEKTSSSDKEQILQEDLKQKEEEEIVTWLLSSIANDHPTDSEDYSKWISDRESELDHIQAGFQSSDSSVSSFSDVLIHEKSQSLSFEYVSEDVDLADLDADEPLFWPYDGKSDWGSELKWDFFIMSPRKHKHKDGTPTSESITLSLCNRKMDFVRRIKTMPSRLGKSPKICVNSTS